MTSHWLECHHPQEFTDQVIESSLDYLQRTGQVGVRMLQSLYLLSVLFIDTIQCWNSEHGVYYRQWMGNCQLGSACLSELVSSHISSDLIVLYLRILRALLVG